MPMPRSIASAGESICDRLPVDQDLSLVGLVAARTGSSSASTCRPRSPRAARGSRRAKVEVDAVVCHDRAESLRDAAQLERRRVVGVMLLHRVGDVRDLAGDDLLLDLLDLDWYFGPAASSLPLPTPPFDSSMIVSLPPANWPAWAALIALNTATSTFLMGRGQDVRPRGRPGRRRRRCPARPSPWRRQARRGRTGRRPGRRPWSPSRSG